MMKIASSAFSRLIIRGLHNTVKKLTKQIIFLRLLYYQTDDGIITPRINETFNMDMEIRNTTWSLSSLPWKSGYRYSAWIMP
jgi:hypothetical protein